MVKFKVISQQVNYYMIMVLNMKGNWLMEKEKVVVL